MINPSTPPIVFDELEAIPRVLHGESGWIIVVSLGGIVMQTPLAVYDSYTADTQQLYKVDGRRPTRCMLKVV